VSHDTQEHPTDPALEATEQDSGLGDAAKDRDDAGFIESGSDI
jgi:hypothetical protein